MTDRPSDTEASEQHDAISAATQGHPDSPGPYVTGPYIIERNAAYAAGSQRAAAESARLGGYPGTDDVRYTHTTGGSGGTPYPIQVPADTALLQAILAELKGLRADLTAPRVVFDRQDETWRAKP